MTLLYIDGFAHQNGNRYAAGAQWSAFGTNATGTPHGYYLQGPGITKPVTASAEIFTGFRWKCGTGAYATDTVIMSLLSDTLATTHLTLGIDSGGHLVLWRGGGGSTLLATGTAVITTNTWTYLEVHATIADSGGVCQVRVNGAATNDINFSGDTKNAGTNTTIDGVRIGQGYSNFFCTDWYICNALGSAPQNSWLGDTAVRTLTPSADGDLSGLTGSDGNSVSNWQQVDELPASSTDYNGSTTSNAEDTYNITDLPSTSVTVYGAQLATFMAKSDAGAASASPIIRLSSTDYTPGAKTLSTSYQEFLDLYPTSPATSTTWTATEIQSVQIGMKVT